MEVDDSLARSEGLLDEVEFGALRGESQVSDWGLADEDDILLCF